MRENGDGMAEGTAEGGGVFGCPTCGEVVSVGAAAAGQWVTCAACGELFVVPEGDGGAELEVVEGTGDVDEGWQSELDGLRMRHLIVQRRAAARSRTYAVLGAVLCAMGAAKLLIMAYQGVRGGGVAGWVIAYGVVAIVAMAGAWYFAGRVAYWTREGRAGVMPEPERPPDFSTLGDGSGKAKDLEDVR